MFYKNKKEPETIMYAKPSTKHIKIVYNNPAKVEKFECIGYNSDGPFTVFHLVNGTKLMINTSTIQSFIITPDYVHDALEKGKSDEPKNDNIYKLVYFGDQYYDWSNGVMSALYTENGIRSDWGKVNVALRDGEKVLIRHATAEEITQADERLRAIRENK